MFGNNSPKRQFSYTSAKSLKTDKSKPLRERIKISSYSSMERKSEKKKIILYILLLLVVLGAIIYFRFSPPAGNNIKIEEKEIEKVNG